MVKIVLDAGHGGVANVGGSDSNHASSPSGVLEKHMTLDLAQRVRVLLELESGVQVRLTRSNDTNLGLQDRARLAKDWPADLFLSIHFNGFNGAVRGTETWIEAAGHGNVNHAADLAYARRIQAAVHDAIKRHDPGARDRGVKEDKVLSVITDEYVGNTFEAAPCRACLVEVEFIDVPAVDLLLNRGPTANEVMNDIAKAIRDALLGA